MKKLLTVLFLLMNLVVSSQCTISIDSSGATWSLIINNNGIEYPGEFIAGHPLWNVDFDSVTVADQQAILTNYQGCWVPVTSSVATGKKIRALITAAQNALDNKRPEYKLSSAGIVTQLTSKATAVTNNNILGTITLHPAALAAGAEVKFTVNNNLIGINDIPYAFHKTAGTFGSYDVQAGNTTNGSFQIMISNKTTATTLSEAIVIGFSITKVN